MNAEPKQVNPYLDVPAVPDKESFSVIELGTGGQGPIEIEIGFGKGHFLLDRAQKHPDISFIGLETRRKWVGLVTARAQKRKLSNVNVWLGDARHVLPRIAEEAVFQRMFIHFPDPWWKVRHEKRKVITESFATDASRTLADGAEVFIQTDVDFRFEDYKRVFDSHELFLRKSSPEGVDKNPFGSRSLREKKCEEVGLPIFRLLYERQSR